MDSSIAPPRGQHLTLQKCSNPRASRSHVQFGIWPLGQANFEVFKCRVGISMWLSDRSNGQVAGQQSQTHPVLCLSGIQLFSEFYWGDVSPSRGPARFPMRCQDMPSWHFSKNVKLSQPLATQPHGEKRDHSGPRTKIDLSPTVFFHRGPLVIIGPSAF